MTSTALALPELCRQRIAIEAAHLDGPFESRMSLLLDRFLLEEKLLLETEAQTWRAAA